jgi:hypothetical protein
MRADRCSTHLARNGHAFFPPVRAATSASSPAVRNLGHVGPRIRPCARGWEFIRNVQEQATRGRHSPQHERKNVCLSRIIIPSFIFLTTTAGRRQRVWTPDTTIRLCCGKDQDDTVCASPWFLGCWVFINRPDAPTDHTWFGPRYHPQGGRLQFLP